MINNPDRTGAYAESYPRITTDEGKSVIDFPYRPEIDLRNKLYPDKVGHPSHNSIYIYEELYRYLYSPGELILDPMGGAGTCMYLARYNVKCWLIELEQAFLDKLHINRTHMEGRDNITIIAGDCTKVMPWPGIIDHVVFSPPYSNQLTASSGKIKMTETSEGELDSYGNFGSIAQGVEQYIQHPDNLSRMQPFYFDQKMIQVYRLCYESLKPGGTIAVINKDRYVARKRVRVSEHHYRLMVRAGFTPFEWHQRYAPGRMFGNYNKARGSGSVEEEDILILRK